MSPHSGDDENLSGNYYNQEENNFSNLFKKVALQCLTQCNRSRIVKIFSVLS